MQWVEHAQSQSQERSKSTILITDRSPLAICAQSDIAPSRRITSLELMTLSSMEILPKSYTESNLILIPPLRIRVSSGLRRNRKKKAGKKRVLKRVYFEANSKQSSYSDVVTSYIDASNPESLEMLSGIIEVNEEQQEDNKEQYEKQIDDHHENSDEAENSEDAEDEKLDDEAKSNSSLPADEHYNSQVNLIVAKNSPRESFKVFNQ